MSTAGGNKNSVVSIARSKNLVRFSAASPLPVQYINLHYYLVPCGAEYCRLTEHNTEKLSDKVELNDSMTFQ